MGFSLTCIASRSVVTCLLFLFFPTCKKLNRDFKGLHHGWLVHIVCNASYTSLFAMELKKLLVNGKINRVKQIRLLTISNQKHKQQKWTLKNKFSKTTIEIHSNLLQVCPSMPFLYILCYLYFLLMFWVVIFKFHSIC